jgi:hypothetical protein
MVNFQFCAESQKSHGRDSFECHNMINVQYIYNIFENIAHSISCKITRRIMLKQNCIEWNIYYSYRAST